MTYSIVADGLVKRFGETVALDGIDLAVRTGSVFGLLGPNGAGKTTAVRILAMLLRPDGGHAEVCGHDVVTHAHQVRQLTGLTGQYASADVLAGLADTRADQAQPARADRLQRAAGDVPAPVHLRVRRRDRGLAEGVSAVRAAGHHRAELAVHHAEHGHRAVDRPGEGVLRPAAVAADRPVRAVVRPHPGRPGQADLDGSHSKFGHAGRSEGSEAYTGPCQDCP